MAGSDTCEGSPPYLYARPPAKEMFQKVPGIPVAAHCVRPLRSAYPIIRIIRHGLGKKQPRLPSLSLLHNMNYVNFTQCSAPYTPETFWNISFASPVVSLCARVAARQKACRSSTPAPRACPILCIPASLQVVINPNFTVLIQLKK